MAGLPPIIPIAEISRRLEIIFPEGVPNRAYLTRDMAGKVIFVMLYIGAVGGQKWLGPKHVYCMTNEQAAKEDDQSRLKYEADSPRRSYRPAGRPWYADTTREPI